MHGRARRTLGRLSVSVSAAIIFAVVAVGLALPQIATASHKKPVPDCADFSTTKLGVILRLHSLRFDGGTDRRDESICTWLTPHRGGHYRDMLTVGITATDVAVFDSEKRAARQQASQTGADFGSDPIRGAEKTFYVTHDFSNDALAPCKPGYTLPAFGPPQCFPEPDWTENSAAAYGRVRPSGPRVFVKVALGAENRPAVPFGVDHVIKDILAGQLR